MISKKVSVRSKEEINQEYSQLCLKAGELQHRIQVSQKDLVKMNSRIDELHTEAEACHQKEEAEKLASFAKEKNNKNKKSKK